MDWKRKQYYTLFGEKNYERVVFSQRAQKESENRAQFGTGVRVKISVCLLRGAESQMRDQAIFGSWGKQLEDSELTFHKVLEFAKHPEVTQPILERMEGGLGSDTVDMITNTKYQKKCTFN